MRWLFPLLLMGMWPASAGAQELAIGQPTGAVLIIDTTRLVSESRYAASLFSEVDAMAIALQEENQSIVETLEAEESDLTARRPTMSPEDFRAEAEAFNAKAQEIRANRDAKELELEEMRRNARVQFLREARSIVGQLMVDRGATVVIDNRSVYVTISPADITDEAIARIDETFLNPPAEAAEAE